MEFLYWLPLRSVAMRSTLLRQHDAEYRPPTCVLVPAVKSVVNTNPGGTVSTDRRPARQREINTVEPLMGHGQNTKK